MLHAFMYKTLIHVKLTENVNLYPRGTKMLSNTEMGHLSLIIQDLFNTFLVNHTFVQIFISTYCIV